MKWYYSTCFKPAQSQCVLIYYFNDWENYAYGLGIFINDKWFYYENETPIAEVYAWAFLDTPGSSPDKWNIIIENGLVRRERERT